MTLSRDRNWVPVHPLTDTPRFIAMVVTTKLLGRTAPFPVQSLLPTQSYEIKDSASALQLGLHQQHPVRADALGHTVPIQMCVTAEC